MGRKTKLETYAERLERSPVFAPLPRDARMQVARQGRRRALDRGQLLWRRDEASDAFALVLSGRLDVVRDTEEGKHLLLRSYGPDSVVGLSTIAGATHSADVVAGASTDILLVRGAPLRDLMCGDATLALQIVVYLAGLLENLTDELEELQTLELEERLIRRLRRLGRGLQEVHFTHAALGTQVGATRANVSRALKRLEERGLLVRKRGRVELL